MTQMNMTPVTSEFGVERMAAEGTSDPWFNSLQLVKSYIFHGILRKF